MFSTYLCCINLQTTSVHALARQLLGSAYSNGVLELNASDSRGIDVSGSCDFGLHVFCNFMISSVHVHIISNTCAHFTTTAVILFVKM